MHTNLNPHHAGFPPLQPDMTWWLSASSRLHDALVAASSEWQGFVAQRAKEDLRLWQELGGAKTPEDVSSACARFWQKALEDYWKEYAHLAQLTWGMPSTVTAGLERPDATAPRAKAA